MVESFLLRSAVLRTVFLSGAVTSLGGRAVQYKSLGWLRFHHNGRDGQIERGSS